MLQLHVSTGVKIDDDDDDDKQSTKGTKNFRNSACFHGQFLSRNSHGAEHDPDCMSNGELAIKQDAEAIDHNIHLRDATIMEQESQVTNIIREGFSWNHGTQQQIQKQRPQKFSEEKT